MHGELVCGLGGVDPVQDEILPLQWWLVLFIEALVLSKY